MILCDRLNAPCQVVLVFDKFCIFWSFLGEKMTINDRTCRNVRTMSEVIQTRHRFLTWACPLASKSWGHVWYFQRNTMFKGECSNRPEGYVWEHLISRHSLNDPIFLMVLYDQFKAPYAKLFGFSSFAFSGVFSMKRANNLPNPKNFSWCLELVSWCICKRKELVSWWKN